MVVVTAVVRMAIMINVKSLDLSVFFVEVVMVLVVVVKL